MIARDFLLWFYNDFLIIIDLFLFIHNHRVLFDLFRGRVEVRSFLRCFWSLLLRLWWFWIFKLLKVTEQLYVLEVVPKFGDRLLWRRDLGLAFVTSPRLRLFIRINLWELLDVGGVQLLFFLWLL